MLLAADFRALHSPGASFDSKVEAAGRLLSGLALDVGAAGSAEGSSNAAAAAGRGEVREAAAAASLPTLVRFHYVKGLLDWTIVALTKGVAGVGGKKSGKAAQQQQQGGAQAAAEGQLRPECWQVLVSLLASSAIPPTYALPAALVPAVAALLGQLCCPAAAAPPPEQLQALLESCAQLLRLLVDKFGGAYRPPLEHSVTLAEAALAGLQHEGAAGALAQEWTAVAEGAVAILRATVAAHPVARKVWEGVLPRLLLPLAATAFPPSAAGGSGQQGALRLQELSQAVLEAVLLHPAHIPGLAEHCEAEFAAAAAGGDPSEDGAQAAGSHARHHYTAQLFEVLSAQLLPEQGSQQQEQQQQRKKRKKADLQEQTGLASDTGGGVAAAVPSLLGLLPWLLDRYCVALARWRRTAEAEAALLKQAAASRRRGQGGGEEDGEAGWQGEVAAAGPAGSLPAAADFQMFAVLLETLLRRAAQLSVGGADAGAGTGQESSAQLVAVIRAVAGLTAPLKSRQAYRPTQDPGGAHRALLQRLVDAMLALAAQQAQQGDSSAAEAAGAVLAVVQGVLAVEHRPIQCHLPALWALLLAPAPAPALTAGASAGASSAAVAVAAGLVGAYAELRQLEVLLSSLANALLAGPSAGIAREAGAAAAWGVVCSSQSLAALREAVRGLPSGQAALLVRWVAALAGQLAESSPDEPMVPVFTEVCACCLSSLEVELTTAPAVAQAAAVLVAALGAPLQQLLALAVELGSPVGGALLPCLLRLYSLALALHARCSALHPQVALLPGQQEQVRAEDLGAGGAQAATALAGGYFAALHQPAPAPALLPVLRALLPRHEPQHGTQQRKSKGGEGVEGSRPGFGAPVGDHQCRVALAAVQAAAQRLQVLHARHLFLLYLCPTAAILPQQPAEGEEGEAAAAAGQGSEAALAQQHAAAAAALQQAAEGELRSIAGVLAQAVAAAVAAAGGSSSGDQDGQGVEYAAAALGLAVGSAEQLLAWAPQEPLQAILQGCFQLATAPAPAAGAPERAQLQAAAFRLLRHPQLLDCQHAQPALLGAILTELHSVIRDLCHWLPPASPVEAEPAAKKSKKARKGRDLAAAAVPNGSHTVAEVGAAPLEAVLGQLKRLARGKAVKAAAWASDQAAALEGIATLAEAAGAIAAGAGAASSPAGKPGNKRKGAQAAAEPALASAGSPQQPSAAAEAAGSLLDLLASLPLQHLGSARGGEGGAALAQAALAAALLAAEAGLRTLPLLGAPQGTLALSLLGTLSSSLLLLSKAMAPAWLPSSSSAAGAAHVAADWPSTLGALCSAAAAMALHAPASAAAGCQRLVERAWDSCSELMAGYTASWLACFVGLSEAEAGMRSWLASLAQQLQRLALAPPSLLPGAGAATLAEGCLAACHTCLRAAAAAASAGGGGEQQLQHGGASSAADVACGPAASLPALAAAGLAGLGGRAEPGGWQQALALQLAAEQPPLHMGALVACIVHELQPALVAAGLGSCRSGSATERSGTWLQREAQGRAFGAMAHVLRMLCLAHPAADALHEHEAVQQQQQQGSIAAAAGQLLLRAAQSLLAEGPASSSEASTLRLLGFLAACCQLCHHARPAPPPSHFASLAAVLLCLLHKLRCEEPAAVALDPVRHTLPFSALFPAASVCMVSADGSSQHSSGAPAPAAAGPEGGSAAARARRAALEALWALVDGCSTPQLTQLLRFAERTLPAGPSSSSSSGQSAIATALSSLGPLPLVELALMVLEGNSSGRAGRVLSHHSERLAGLLTGFVASAAAAAAGGVQGLGQQRQTLAAAAWAGAGNAAPDGRAVAQALLAAGERAPSGDAQPPQLDPQQPAGSSAPDTAALCTAWRALESLAGRPNVAPLSGRQVANMVHGVGAWWAACTAWPAGEGAGAPAGRALCGVSQGAALFTGSCALLLAILRHRQEEMGRCMPLLLQAVRALLAWLVGAEAAAKLAAARAAAGAAVSGGGGVPGWRVKCAEALSRVLAEIAALKAAISRYCPHLLADYLILAASPLTPKALALLGRDPSSSEDTAASPAAPGSSSGQGAGAGEEDPLSGGALSSATAAALRQGACTVYGACSASELQYLYASLGQKGGAVWRTALAALKAQYEQQFKYTGKV